MDDLLRRMESHVKDRSLRNPVCRGTLLSRSQYRIDVETWGYEDARHQPVGSMTPEEAMNWTKAGEERPKTKTNLV
jgi:hypothetical protein